MQITSDSIAGRVVVFDSILDEVPGGVALNVTRLDYLTSGKEYIAAGTPVYVDQATRVAEVCKSVAAAAGSAATEIVVLKAHHFKVGDYLNDGTTGGIITAIDTTSSDTYDTITVNTSLTYAEGTKYQEGTATGSSTALKYIPNGMVKSQVYIKDGNADASVVTMGQAREDALTYPLTSAYKVALRGGTSGTGSSLITVV